eukprot:365186-Chlamydomonas_euryale.AAC.8
MEKADFFPPRPTAPHPASSHEFGNDQLVPLSLPSVAPPAWHQPLPEVAKYGFQCLTWTVCAARGAKVGRHRHPPAFLIVAISASHRGGRSRMTRDRPIAEETGRECAPPHELRRRVAVPCCRGLWAEAGLDGLGASIARGIRLCNAVQSGAFGRLLGSAVVAPSREPNLSRPATRDQLRPARCK